MKSNEIRELLSLMLDEMHMIWSNYGFSAIVASAVRYETNTDALQALLRRAWVKSWYWMPELEPRVKAVLA